jgi:hypothetical protein
MSKSNKGGSASASAAAAGTTSPSPSSSSSSPKTTASQVTNKARTTPAQPDVTDDESPAVPTICAVCGTGEHEDLVLVCDGPGCKNEIHMYCLRPPVLTVPTEDWFCPCCDQKKSLENLEKSISVNTERVRYFEEFLSKNNKENENKPVCDKIACVQQSYYPLQDWATDHLSSFSRVPSEFERLGDKLVGMVALIYSDVDSMYHSGRILAQHPSERGVFLIHFRRSAHSWLPSLSLLIHSLLIVAKTTGT